MSAALEGLLSRVEAATGPDAGLEADIAIRLGLVPDGFEQHEQHSPIWWKRDPDDPIAFDRWQAPPLTGSVDSALALVERALPGWNFVIGRKMAAIHPLGVDGLTAIFNTHNGHCATPALSLLAALIRALLAKASPQ